jgi:hypothetical protein
VQKNHRGPGGTRWFFVQKTNDTRSDVLSLRAKILGISAGILLLALVRPLIGQQDQADTVCPLTAEQTQKSIQAFAQITPLLHHPRCENCHGGVDPFSETGNHGGDQAEKAPTVTPAMTISTGLGKSRPNPCHSWARTTKLCASK